MSVINATNFRKNFFKYLDSAIETNEIITVTTKSGNAVVISEEEYNGMLETAYINSIPNLANSILQGKNADASEFTELDWKNEL